MPKEQSSRKKRSSPAEAIQDKTPICANPAEAEIRDLVDEERYKAVFESANDLMLIFDKKGKIIDVNGRSVEISGYAKDEVIGKHLKVLSKILTRKSLVIVLGNFLKRMAGIDVPPYEIEIIKKTGELLIFEVSAQPLVKDDKIMGNLAILRDITKRKQIETETHQKSADIHLINQINEAANQGKSFEDIFRLVSSEMRKLFGGSISVIYLTSSDKQFLVMEYLDMPSRTIQALEKTVGFKITNIKIRLKPGGYYSRILENGKAVLTNDREVMQNKLSEYSEDPTLLKYVPLILKKLGTNSAVSVPLKSNNETIGLLETAKSDLFTEEDMRRIGTITGQLTTIIKRKQTADALRQNEELFRTMIEASSEGFALCDGLVITDINRNGARIFGYEAKEMLNKKFADFAVPESQAIINKHFVAGYEKPYEAIFRKKDGITFPAEIRASTIHYKGKAIWLQSFRDLTVQKQYTTMLENISVNAPIGMYVVLNNRFILVNKRFCRDTGRTEQELLAQDIMDNVYPADRELVRGKTAAMLKGEINDPYEFRVTAKNGEIRYILQSVASIDFINNQPSYLATYLDITEKRRIEMALIKNEQNLQQAQTLGKIGNWECDITTEKLEWSDEAYRLYNRDKSLGPLSPEEEKLFYSPEEYKKLKEHISLAINQGTDQSYDLTVKLSGNKTVWISSFVHPVKNKEGRVIKLFGTVQDITERKIIEEALKASEQNFRNSLDSSFIGIRIEDREGRNLYANQAVLDIFGYANVDELIDSPPQLHYTLSASANYRKHHAKMMEGQAMPDKAELDIVRKDGSIRNLEVSRQEVLWDGKIQYQTSYNDITERKKAEEARNASERNFRNSIDGSLVGIRIIDANWHTLYANKVFLAIFGYKDIQDMGMVDPKELYTPREYQRYVEREEKRRRGEAVSEENLEQEIVRRDGAIRYIQTSRSEVLWNGQKQYQLLCNDITERKEAEKALQASEQNFRNSIDSSPMGVHIVDADFHTLYANRVFLDIFGYKNIDELKVSPPHLHYTPEEHIRHMQRNEKQAEGGAIPDKLEMDIVRSNGEIRHVQVFRKEVFWDGKQEYQLIYNDITGRKRAEEDLKASEEKYSTLIEQSTDGILILNVHTIEFANSRILELSGYTHSEIIGKQFIELVSPDDKIILNDSFKRVLPVGTANTLEMEFIAKDGRHIAVETRAHPIEYRHRAATMVIVSDVTERKTAEKQLRESEENLKTYLENAPDGIYLSDLRGSFLYGNKKAEEILGYRKDELIGSSFLELNLLVPRYLQKAAELLAMNAAGKYTGPDEFELVRKDGSTVWAEINTAPIMQKDKKVIIGFVRDISERKRAEDALRTAEEKYSTLIEQSADGIVILDDRLIIFANRKICEISGYSQQEINGKPFYDLFNQESVAILDDGYQRRKAGEVVSGNYELVVTSKTGKNIFVTTEIQRIVYKEKLTSMIIIRDITERKQAEAALKASEAKYSALIEQSIDGIIILNDRRLEFANKKISELTGYSQDEIIGKLFPDLFVPEDKQILDEGYGIRQASDKILPTDYDLKLLTKDGRKIPVETKAQRIFHKNRESTMVVIRDVTERKQAEELYHTLVDSAPVGVYILQDNKLVFANQALQQQLGYSETELLNIKPANLVCRDDRSAVQEYTKNMLQGKRTEPYEYRVCTKSGYVKWTLEQVTNITYRGRQATMGITLDTTQGKQDRQLYESLAANSPVGVYIRQNEKLVFTNPAFQKATGYSAEELAVIDPVKLIHPEDSDHVKASINEMVKGSLSQPYEFRLLTKTGETRWGLERLNSITYLGNHATLASFMDITERKQAEDKLEQAAQEWRTTFDSITDLIIIHDKENRILRVNKAVADLLKTTPKELVGKYCFEALHGTSEPPLNCPHRQTMKTGKVASSEIYNPGFETYFHESTSPLFNDQGEVTGSIMVARDITQQKHIEEQLIMTDRLASIGELSSGVAHELNNPLTSVIGFSQLLMEGDIPDNIREDLTIVYTEAKRAAAIVKNLLTFARKHAPVKQLCQVNSVIDDVLKLRAYEQKVNNIEVVNKMTAELPGIMVDPFQMQQVFLNIIVNAEFAMLEAHHRGRITITTEKIDSSIKISFADDGPGISEENLKHIFDPFFTTKEVGKGTGLGLSICHGIINEHGGKIYAKSEKGQGATFIIELPLYRKETPYEAES